MPDTKSNRYKLLKWIAATLLIILILLAGLAWFLNVKSQPLLSSRIKTLLYKSTDSLYNISFSKVTTNILTGSATLYNVKITPDTNRFNQLITLKRAPNNLYTVPSKNFRLNIFILLRFIGIRNFNSKRWFSTNPRLVWWTVNLNLMRTGHPDL